MKTCGLFEKCKINDVEFMSTIVAGACHDHEHPGFNNVFLIDTKDPIAIRYNGKDNYLYLTKNLDVSVLENHHIASSFAIMQEPNHNILDTLSKDDYKRSRQVMI
jgi:hypothetical protein